MTTDDPTTGRSKNATGTAPLPARSIDTDELFDGQKQVVITHNRDRYVLRITRQGKLILNK